MTKRDERKKKKRKETNDGSWMIHLTVGFLFPSHGFDLPLKGRSQKNPDKPMMITVQN